MGENLEQLNPTSEASLIHNTNTQYYSFTIKYIRKGVKAEISSLEKTMYYMIKKFDAEYCTHSVEQDSLGRNHLHGVFLASKHIRYNSISYPYTHIYIRRLDSYRDLVNWCDYIQKDEQTSLIDYFTNGENHFIQS